MEVIYTRALGKRSKPSSPLRRMGVDVIGVSSLATDHLLIPKLMTALLAAGVARVFHPGARREEIVAEGSP